MLHFGYDWIYFVNSIAENTLGSRALGIRDGVNNHSPSRLLGNRDSLTFD